MSVVLWALIIGGEQRTRAMSKDSSVSQTDQILEQDHQKRLAISLVASLGVEGAIHTCQTNSWNGVLKWVIALGEAGEGDTSHA